MSLSTHLGVGPDSPAVFLVDFFGKSGLLLCSGVELKRLGYIIIIIDNFCIALFSDVPKLTALYILQHFLSFTNIIHIIMTTNNV